MKNTVDIKFVFPQQPFFQQAIACNDDSEDEDFFNKNFNSTFSSKAPLTGFLKSEKNASHLILLRNFTKMLLCTDKFVKHLQVQKEKIKSSYINQAYTGASKYHLENIVKIHGVTLDKFYSVQYQEITEHIDMFIKENNTVASFVTYAKDHGGFLKNTDRLDFYQPTFRGKLITRDTIYKNAHYYDINREWKGDQYNFNQLFATAMVIHRSNKRLIKDIENTIDLQKNEGVTHITKNTFFQFPNTGIQVQESHKITINAITSKVNDIGSYTDITSTINQIIKWIIINAEGNLEPFYQLAIEVARSKLDLITSKVVNDKIKTSWGETEKVITTPDLSPTVQQDLYNIIDEGTNCEFNNIVINELRHVSEDNAKYINSIEVLIIDEGLISILQGRGITDSNLKQYEKFLCNLTYLLFVCETIRNPNTLLTVPMFLDLVKSDKHQLNEIDKYFPMAMKDAVSSSEILTRVYNACFQKKCYPVYHYNTGKNDKGKQLGIEEAELFEQWLSLKDVNNVLDIGYHINSLITPLYNTDFSPEEMKLVGEFQ